MVETFGSTDEFESAFGTLATTGDKFITIFTGTINEETNESWCPDCVEAKPIIQKLVDDGKRKIIKAAVTRDEWMGNAGHPYKTSGTFKCAGVPTVILFEGSNELHRVDDLADFNNEDLMGLFLED